MSINIGINGFGRIGKVLLRIIENNTFFICLGCYMSRSRLMSSPYYQLGYEYLVIAYFFINWAQYRSIVILVYSIKIIL